MPRNILTIITTWVQQHPWVTILLLILLGWLLTKPDGPERRIEDVTGTRDLLGQVLVTTQGKILALDDLRELQQIPRFGVGTFSRNT
jgi:hypothetical protein